MEPEKSSAAPLWVERASALVSVIAPLASLAAVVLYLVLRDAYVQYYRQFNLTPEEAGLGYFEVLVGSAGTILVVVGFPAIFLLTLIGAPRRRPRRGRAPLTARAVGTERRSEVPPWARRFLIPGIALAGSALILAARGLLGELWIILTVAIVVRLFVSVRIDILMILVLVASTMLGSLTFPQRVARLRGLEVTNGLATSPLSIVGGIDFVAIRATAVRVRWLDRPEIAENPCLMYIGARPGTVLLVDPFRDRTLQVPSSEVVLEIPHQPRDVPDACADRFIKTTMEQMCVHELENVASQRLTTALCGLFDFARRLSPEELRGRAREALTPELRRQLTPRILGRFVDVTERGLRRVEEALLDVPLKDRDQRA